MSANEGPLMRYIAKKWLWSDTKMESINWGAFRITTEETCDHLILRTASEPRKWRTGVLSEIQKVLSRLHTAPALCK
eukprot:5601084-Ditylum_brightwellii.AAC.1